MLQEIDAWLTWITDLYLLDHRSIPACWPAHPELIDELSIVHLAWQAAYVTLADTDATLT